MSRGARDARERPQTRNVRMSIVKEKDEELALFLEMRKREKERDDLLVRSSEVLEAPLGVEQGRSHAFDILSSIPAPTRKNYSDEFLNSENDKNDYDWLLTPPGTPLFPSLEMGSHKTVMNQIGTASKPHHVALKSRLANTQLEVAAKSSLPSRQTNPAPGLNTSTIGLRRTSSSCGPVSRPSTPTGRSTLTTLSPKSTFTASKPVATLPTRSSKLTVTSSSKPSRSSTPTSRATLTSTTKPTVPARPSSPQSRTTARSSTPTTRPTLPASNKPPSRSATPTRRTPTVSTVTDTSSSSIKSQSVVAARPAAAAAAAPTTTKSTTQPRPSSPTVKSRSWNPSEMPGFTLDAPPNLRTTLPNRPLSATRGRPGAPSSRSSSVEPGNTGGRVRRQSCSPSRGRAPNGTIHGCGSSVPAMSRLHAKANDNISPVLVGTKMVERVINMRKLAPPRQDDKHSPLSNFSGKSSSPDGSGFGRSLSKKSLDMAIRHMDIRRTIPINMRPLMTNIPASSMYSVRSGHSQSRTISLTDSPLATSSNASSEMSVNNNGLYPEVDDSISSSNRRCIPSPSNVRGR